MVRFRTCKICNILKYKYILLNVNNEVGVNFPAIYIFKLFLEIKI